MGGPKANQDVQQAYGWGKQLIDTSKPFTVKTHTADDGDLSVVLEQDGHHLEAFTTAKAGNPKVLSSPLTVAVCEFVGRQGILWGSHIVLVHMSMYVLYSTSVALQTM